MTERLYRHPTDRAIAGVAGGLAAWLNIDPSIVRIAWVLLAVFTGGAFVLVYIVMMIVIPLPPPGWIPRPRDAGWGAPSGGWTDPSSSAGWGPTAAPGGAPGPAQGWGPPDGANPAAASPGPTGSWGAAPTAGPTTGWVPTAGSTWTAPRAGNAGIVAGVVLVGLGAWFLIDQYVDINWDALWPVIIMVLGGLLIAGALLRGRNS